MKKSIYLYSVVLIFGFFSCDDGKEVFQYNTKTYWGKFHAGGTTTLQADINVYYNGQDTLLYWAAYYPNGKLKSKAKYVGEQLDFIEFVLDTMGNKLEFGSIINGNGIVTQYDYKGIPERRGRYVNGNRDGWWIFYHYSGTVIDSTLYKDGFYKDGLGMKDNLYD